MKRAFVVGAALSALVSFPAAAADVGVPLYKAPAYAPLPFSWTGFYVGANAGGRWERATLDPSGGDTILFNQASGFFAPGRGIVIVPGTTQPMPSFELNSKGNFIGGGQVGYNLQFQRWVVGVEGDVQIGSRERSTQYSLILPVTAISQPANITLDRSLKTNWTSSIRVRAGYTVMDRVLLYGTGGLAIADVRVTATDTYLIPPGPGAAPLLSTIGPLPPSIGTATETRTLLGWTIGGGADWAVTDNIIIGFQYRHSDFGTKVFNVGTNSSGMTTTISGGGALPGMITTAERVRLTDDQITARISFRFGPM